MAKLRAVRPVEVARNAVELKAFEPKEEVEKVSVACPVVVDTETSLILAVTPQGQLVVTPVKTISVAAPEAPLAWQPEVVVAPEPPTDAPAPDAPASDAPAAEPATEAPTGDATAPTGDPATT